MLGEYRDIGDKQSDKMSRLKKDLLRTQDELDGERLRQSLRDQGGHFLSDADDRLGEPGMIKDLQSEMV